MDSFQITGQYDPDVLLWKVSVDPKRKHSAFVTAPTLSEALFRATGMLLETRKFRREQVHEKLKGEDGFEI